VHANPSLARVSASPLRTSTMRRTSGPAFTDIGAGLPGVVLSAVAWGDYDGDGDLDFAMAGSMSGTPITRIYRNDGGAFTDIGGGLPGASSGGPPGNRYIAWGDYDNDGDLDLVIVCSTYSKIFRNDGGSFVDIGAVLPHGPGVSVAWGD